MRPSLAMTNLTGFPKRTGWLGVSERSQDEGEKGWEGGEKHSIGFQDALAIDAWQLYYCCHIKSRTA